MTMPDPTLTDAAQRVGAFLDVLEKMAGPKIMAATPEDIAREAAP